MILFNISFLLFCFYFVQSQDTICKSQDACRCILNSTATIDLTAVGSTKYPRFYEVSFENSNCSSSFALLYSYNPCYGFDSPDVNVVTKKGFQPCSSAAACVRTSGGDKGELPEEYAIGLQKNAHFNFKNQLPFIEYPFPATDRELKVFLICNESSEDHRLTMVEATCDGTGQTVFNLTSKCCCPNGCPVANPKVSTQGLSTGSVLLITFFTLLMAYLIVGILWKFFNGAQGIEVLPNFEFWNEFPTLVVEGISFTFSCCGRKATYGEV